MELQLEVLSQILDDLDSITDTLTTATGDYRRNQVARIKVFVGGRSQSLRNFERCRLNGELTRLIKSEPCFYTNRAASCMYIDYVAVNCGEAHVLACDKSFAMESYADHMTQHMRRVGECFGEWNAAILLHAVA